MISIALLMIDHIYDDAPSEIVKVAGEPILYHQIVQLRNFGINRFIVTVEKVDSKALNIAANLRREGIEIEFVSRLSALSDMLGSDDKFLMISDGIWSSDKHIENIIYADGSEILVFENDENLSQFELIDLNYRWCGLARLNGELLYSIDNLPEDSAVQSTLLRIALQQNYPLKVIEYVEESLSKIADQSAADRISKDRIKSSQERMNIRGFFETIIFYPLVNFLMPSLWKENEVRPVVGYAIEYSYLLFFALAIISATFNLEILSFTLTIIACFTWFFREVYNHIKPIKDNISSTMFGNISIFLILTISAYHWQNLWSISGVIVTLFLGLSVKKLDFQTLYNRLIFSFSDIFLIMILASFFNVQIYAIMVIAMLYSLWIFGGTILMKSKPY